MTIAPMTVTFDFAGYDFGKANTVIVRRLQPSKAISVVVYVFAFGCLAIAASTLTGSPRTSLAGPTFAGLIVASLAAFAIRARFYRRNLWQAASQSPYRTGQMTVMIDPTRLTASNQRFTTALTWSADDEGVEVDDGLLLLVGKLDHFAIPAKAFASKSDQDAFFAAIRAYLAAADSHEVFQ